MQFRLGYFFLVPRARWQRALPKAAPGVKQDHQCNIIGAFGEGCVLPPHCNRAGGAATAPPGIFYAFQFWAPLTTSCGPLLAPRVQQSLYFQGAQTGHRCQKRDLGLEVPAHRRNRKQNSSPFQPDIHPDGGGMAEGREALTPARHQYMFRNPPSRTTSA